MVECVSCRNRYHYYCVTFTVAGAAKPVRGSAKVMQAVREADPDFEYTCKSCSTANSVHCIPSCTRTPSNKMIECSDCKNRYHYNCVNFSPPGAAVKQQRGSEHLVQEIRKLNPSFAYKCASCEAPAAKPKVAAPRPKAPRPKAAVPHAAKEKSKCKHNYQRCRVGQCVHICCEHFRQAAQLQAATIVREATARKTAPVAPAPLAYTQGQEVLYIDAHGGQSAASISHVDCATNPASYTIKFANGEERGTEASRIQPVAAQQPTNKQDGPAGAVSRGPTPMQRNKTNVTFEQMVQIKNIINAPSSEGHDKGWLVTECRAKFPHIPEASIRAVIRKLSPQGKAQDNVHHAAAQQGQAQQEQYDEDAIEAAGIYGGDASTMARAQLGEDSSAVWGQRFGGTVAQVLARHSALLSGGFIEQLQTIEALLRSKLCDFPVSVQRKLLGKRGRDPVYGNADDYRMPTRVQEAAIVFEAEEMGRSVRKCPECHEVRCFLANEDDEDGSMCDLCQKRSQKDMKSQGSNPSMAPMFSLANKMHFRPVPWFLRGLRIVERQMIAMVNCYIDVHHLKYGMTATKGHAVSFPSGMNIMRILPRLAEDCGVIIFRRKALKSGKIYHYCVRKKVVYDALVGLKYGSPRDGVAERTDKCPIEVDGRYYECEPCPPYAGMEIDFERICALPDDDELPDLPVIYVDPKEASEGVQPGEKPGAAKKRKGEAMSDLNLGPCPMQNELPGQSEYTEVEEFDTLDRSGVVTHKEVSRTQKEMQTLLKQFANGDDPTKAGITVCSMNAKESTLLKEMETPYFFTMYAPDVFICGDADITAPRERAPTLAPWIGHIYWLEDNRVAAHPHLKYLLRSLKMRTSALSQGSFCIKGAADLSREDIIAQLDDGDNSIVNRVLSVAANIPGTETYRRGLKQELSALSRFKAIGEKPYNGEHKSLPIIFHTGSCAEFHWKPLHDLCEEYLRATNGDEEALKFKNDPLFRQQSLLRLGHVVTWYFDKRTMNFFKNVLPEILHDHGLDDYYLIYEFTKLRGAMHYHSMLWSEKLYKLVQGILDSDSELEAKATDVAQVAEACGWTAMHPAGGHQDENGDWVANKADWLLPDGEKEKPKVHPAAKLLRDVVSHREDAIELVNMVMLHVCSSKYCINNKKCKMHFGAVGDDGQTSGKECSNKPGLVGTKKRTRLELSRDHPRMMQHMKWTLPIWRANTDMQLITMMEVQKFRQGLLDIEDYLCSYMCKGGSSSDEMRQIFRKLINGASDMANAKQLAQRLMMRIVGMTDVPAAEVDYMLSGGVMYHTSRRSKRIGLSDWKCIVPADEETGIVVSTKVFEKFTAEARHADHPDLSAWEFFSLNGVVPIFTGVQQYCVFPITEEYASAMLRIYSPGTWMSEEELKDPNDGTFKTTYLAFLGSANCPRILEDEYERAYEKHQNEVAAKLKTKAVKRVPGTPVRRPLNYRVPDDLADEPGAVADPNSEDESLEQCDHEVEHDDEIDYEGELNRLQAGLISDFDWSQSYTAGVSDAASTWLADQIEADSQALESHQPDEATLGLKWFQRFHPTPFPDSTELAQHILSLPNVTILSSNFRQRVAIAMAIRVHQKIANNEECVPLRMAVFGAGGVGKSHVINALTRIHQRLAYSKLQAQSCKAHVNAAFQACAANLIGGRTMHSVAGSMPKSTGKNGKKRKDQTWADISISVAKQKLNVDMVKDLLGMCIDEISTPSPDLFGAYDHSVREAGQTNSLLEVSDSFGDVPVVVTFGDIAQLGPIGAPMLVTDLDPHKHEGLTLHGLIAMQPFLETTMVLNEVMRNAPGQEELRERNLRARNGTLTRDDLKTLNSRAYHKLTHEQKQGKFENDPKRHIYIYAKKKKMRAKNFEELKRGIEEHGNPVASIRAEGQGSCHSSAGTNGDMGQLDSTVYLGIGTRVMVTKNQKNQWKLSNGATGVVISIVYKPGTAPPCLPLYVVVSVPTYTGPIWDIANPTHIPVAPATSRCDQHNGACTRTQLPLRACYALNTHKIQGMSFGPGKDIESYTFDPGDVKMENLNKGLFYVVVSRAMNDECWATEREINWDRLAAVNNHRAMANQRMLDARFERQAQAVIVEYGAYADEEAFAQLLKWVDDTACDGVQDSVYLPKAGETATCLQSRSQVTIIAPEPNNTSLVLFPSTSRQTVLRNAELTPLRQVIDAQAEIVRARAILATPAPPEAEAAPNAKGPKQAPTEKPKQAPAKKPKLGDHKPFKAMDWHLPHVCEDQMCEQLGNPYGRAALSRCKWSNRGANHGTNRCHIDVFIVAINAVLSHGNSSLRGDMINHMASRGKMTEAINGLFANSTAGAMETSTDKSLEEHAEVLWALLHQASASKVAKPGDCGDAVTGLQAFIEQVSMPTFSTLLASVHRECSPGCSGHTLLDYGAGAHVVRVPEQPRDSALFLRSPALAPNCDPRTDPLLFMTLLEETTVEAPCVRCRSPVKASRQETAYPEILRLDITRVLHGMTVECMGTDDVHYFYGEPYQCVCIMCNTGENHWIAVVKGKGGQWWLYDDIKKGGTATKTDAAKAKGDKRVWYSPVLIYTRTHGQRVEHDMVLVDGGRVGEEGRAHEGGHVWEPTAKRARRTTQGQQAPRVEPCAAFSPRHGAT